MLIYINIYVQIFTHAHHISANIHIYICVSSGHSFDSIDYGCQAYAMPGVCHGMPSRMPWHAMAYAMPCHGMPRECARVREACHGICHGMQEACHGMPQGQNRESIANPITKGYGPIT